LAHFQQVLNHLAASATGSANRVARLLLLPEPPSIDKGEVTDKGSINQRAVLKHRDALVQDFHNNLTPNTLRPH
jgi:feruloyl-CoA synthase